MRLTKKQKQFLEQLENKEGNISQVCKSISIDRSTFYKWIQQNQHFKKEYEHVRENLIDDVESSLMKNIKGGDTIATIFFLKTRAKHRGYVEKQQLELSVDEQIQEWLRGKK